ncbi:hypothetical protein TSUD_380020 [Trifolium subterraneum]|uniref:Uncharacterized protein n=1 Tax=Trifolium subterraneum TaxID=3900 RepID=A0A2Z6MK57_TRISU|nr:hypothetical protein TSUD_380020 [Trifolium subterraneum]
MPNVNGESGGGGEERGCGGSGDWDTCGSKGEDIGGEIDPIIVQICEVIWFKGYKAICGRGGEDGG